MNRDAAWDSKLRPSSLPRFLLLVLATLLYFVARSLGIHRWRLQKFCTREAFSLAELCSYQRNQARLQNKIERIIKNIRNISIKYLPTIYKTIRYIPLYQNVEGSVAIRPFRNAWYISSNSFLFHFL